MGPLIEEQARSRVPDDVAGCMQNVRGWRAEAAVRGLLTCLGYNVLGPGPGDDEAGIDLWAGHGKLGGWYPIQVKSSLAGAVDFRRKRGSCDGIGVVIYRETVPDADMRRRLLHALDEAVPRCRPSWLAKPWGLR